MVPYFDIQKVNAPYEAAFQNNIRNFFSSKSYILGPAVSQFETAFAEYCGVSECIGVGNGLDALTLILRGYIFLGKLKTGDKVIVPAFTFVATALAVHHAGLIPVLVDCNEQYTMDPEACQKAVNEETKAIIPVHLYGQLTDMKALREIAEMYNLLIICDAAQAHGAQNEGGERAGSLGNASAFSFYPTKNLGALGDGGAITTNDSELAEAVRMLQNYGSRQKYIYLTAGYNSRLDELQAYFLLLKLEALDEMNHQRRKRAARYISDLNNQDFVLPNMRKTEEHVFYAFVIRTQKRSEWLARLDAKSIGYALHYPKIRYADIIPGAIVMPIPQTERCWDEVISLPLYPNMPAEDQEKVISVLNEGI